MIDEALKTAWNWLKTAPLPVVLVLCVLAAGVSATYSKSENATSRQEAVEARKDAADARAAAAEARTQSAEAKAADSYVQNRIQQLDAKMDKVLEAVGELKVLQAQATCGCRGPQARADERCRRDSQKPPQ